VNEHDESEESKHHAVYGKIEDIGTRGGSSQ